MLPQSMKNELKQIFPDVYFGVMMNPETETIIIRTITKDVKRLSLYLDTIGIKYKKSYMKYDLTRFRIIK